MKKLFAAIMAVVLIACLSFTALAEEAVDGLVARYTFDENKADDGLTENGTQLTYADGKITLGDSGNTSYLTSDIDFTGFEEITVGMRLTLPADSNGGQWVYDITSQSSHDGNPAYGFAMYYESGKLHAQIYAGCSSPVPPTAEATLDIGYLEGTEFVPVVVTYSSDNVLTLYADDDVISVDVDTDAALAELFGDAPAMQIGRCSWGSGFYGRAIQIDEISIYDRALTEDEVLDTFDIKLYDYDAETEPETDAETEPETEPVTEKPETEAQTEKETQAVTTNSSTSTEAAADSATESSGGCGSTLGATAVILAIASVFGVAVKRRR